MLHNDVRYLQCITCHGALHLRSFIDKAGECEEGALVCKHCSKQWPVIGGIPRLLPDALLAELVVPHYPSFFAKHNFALTLASASASHSSHSINEKKDEKKKSLKIRTAQSFGFEWLAYPKILQQFEKDWSRYFHPFIQVRDMKKEVVVDIGCGMGKHGYFACKYGAKYIGVDMSLAVEAVYKNTKHFRPLRPLIVQADVYHLPINGRDVDLWYSIGVLHHLPEPEAGFQSVTKHMTAGSRILIWVYGTRKNLRALWLYNPIRAVTTRLPGRFLYALCFIPAIIVQAVNTVQLLLQGFGLQRVARKLPFWYYVQFPFMFKVSDSFDVFGTPKQEYYTADEIRGWFSRANMKSFAHEHDIVQGIKAYGTK